MQGGDGRWFSGSGYEDRPYICQKWPAGNPTPPPEIIVQGGCPAQWYPYKSRCFQFSSGMNGNADLKPWENATDACAITEGASLATVPDQVRN